MRGGKALPELMSGLSRPINGWSGHSYSSVPSGCTLTAVLSKPTASILSVNRRQPLGVVSGEGEFLPRQVALTASKAFCSGGAESGTPLGQMRQLATLRGYEGCRN